MGVHPEPADHPELPAGELPPEPSGGGGEGRLPGVELAVPRGKYRHLRHMVHQHDPGGKGAQAGHLHPHVPGGGIQGGRFNRHYRNIPKPVPNPVCSFGTCLFLYTLVL